MADPPAAPSAALPALPNRIDPWSRLRALTPARVGLSRTGTALGLPHVLEFQSAHAAARDAVHAPLDTAALAQQLAPRPTLILHSQAPDRATYLRRPDLGRRLAPDCTDAIIPPPAGCDLAFVLADGLSAGALLQGAPSGAPSQQGAPSGAPSQQGAAALVTAILDRLPGLSTGPIAIATQARVAIGDDIGARLHAGIVIVLIGERPGLSVAESLGAYLTWSPHPGRRDSERNCVSNIHNSGGLSIPDAAALIARLILGARQLGLSGVGLKDAGSVIADQQRQGLCP